MYDSAASENTEPPLGWFVTGTDTGVGKTHVAAALMWALRAGSNGVVGMKPIATGCESVNAQLRSPDALVLAEAADLEKPYACINPYAFAPPIAPHIAAARAGVRIEVGVIVEALEEIRRGARYVIVEGIGGWRVPIDETRTLADVVRCVGYPAILVVGLRLGCLNHALLTVSGMAADGVRCAGWIANPIDPGYETPDETIAALRDRLQVPLLATLPWSPGTPRASSGAHLEQACDTLLKGERRKC